MSPECLHGVDRDNFNHFTYQLWTNYVSNDFHSILTSPHTKLQHDKCQSSSLSNEEWRELQNMMEGSLRCYPEITK